MDIQEKIGQSAFQPGAPTFVDREARTGDSCGGFQVKNSGALADFPVRLGLKIEVRSCAPTADFLLPSAPAP